MANKQFLKRQIYDLPFVGPIIRQSNCFESIDTSLTLYGEVSLRSPDGSESWKSYQVYEEL